MTRRSPTLTDRLLGVLAHRQSLGARGRSPRRDLIAGLTVAIVPLPLALGFGISSGMGAGDRPLGRQGVPNPLLIFYVGSHRH